MSTSRVSSHKSRSSHSKLTRNANPIPPPPTLTPENNDREFEPCAATSSYFLYAQRNIVLCLHHDTLAIERRFDRHLEDVRWIAADTVSERGAGRLAVSYDAGHTAIVWDITTGDEIARFAAYEEIRVATWMRNGNIAFGNVQGNVILFEPSTSEHISARTIYDPITAIAPVSDNRTFAIGYLNGSILIATLQPFTMVHSLNTSNAPSRVTGLAWHGSATRQKSDMLATQTADGNLKVWSIPKVPNGETPNIIRILNRPDNREHGPCWFAWSKLGRIVHHSGGETRSWDVRTKNVSFESVPTHDNTIGIANCGPTSALFTMGNNHTIQQYDITPGQKPSQVASVHHAPAKTPPSPPHSIEEEKGQAIATLPTLGSDYMGYSDAETSEGEAATMSPLQRIAQEMDQLEDERRDHLGPLSPVSSRASSVSSHRSSEGGRRAPSYRFDKPASSRASNASGYEGTEFSFGQSVRQQPVRASVSTRSTTSHTSAKYRSSGLRKEIIRSPVATPSGPLADLFPFVRARLRDVPFRTPHYSHMSRTPDMLRQEMLSVVFGWNDDIELLIRDELTRLPSGSANRVLLSQWLGDLRADSMAAMLGSESMTSADWMLLALSTMGHASQKKVGEAFVHRLLEKGDIHPAVAILLGLGEENDAIEVYVSRSHYMEAVLLTCLVFPSDWQRQSYLVRKWGEILVAQGQPELAVRCFSCTSVESSEPWFSPRAQDSAFAAQSEHMNRPILSPPLSPPSATESGRLRPRNASLKLITSFGDRGALSLATERTPMAGMLGVGVTPIAESAISPGGAAPWLRASQKKEREPSSARTATPGGYARKRLQSQSGAQRTHKSSDTPLTASRDFAPSVPPNNLPEQFTKGHSRRTSSASSNNPDRLPSPTQDVFARLKNDPKARNGSRERLPVTLQVQVYDTAYLGLEASAGQDPVSSQGRVGRVNEQVQHRGVENDGRSRELSESRGRQGMRYIKSGKRSPSSPVPMSPEEVAAATRAMEQKIAQRSASQKTVVTEPIDERGPPKSTKRAASRQRKPQGDNLRSDSRGRNEQKTLGSAGRSPSSPLPISRDPLHAEGSYDSRPVQLGGFDLGRPPVEQKGGHPAEDSSGLADRIIAWNVIEPSPIQSPQPRDQENLARKRLAARELEDRRASLARRPSAPVIPLPGTPDIRPPLAPRFHTELGETPHSFLPPLSGPIQRSHTVEPHEMMRSPPRLGGQTSSSASIGLPATPRAMRYPYHMSSDNKDNGSVPAVPEIPQQVSTLASAFPQRTGDTHDDAVAPLLPSTVFSFSGPQSPPRSASVPLERYERNPAANPARSKATLPQLPNTRGSIDRGHSRRTSQPEGQSAYQHTELPYRTSIDETLHEDEDVVVVVDSGFSDVVLPELQHLTTPPPPPPPPMFLVAPDTRGSQASVIDFEDAPMIIDVLPTIPRAATSSPTHAMSSLRRGRNSSVSEGIGSRFRGVKDRMRSTSRPRPKSPDRHNPMPYETVLPQVATRHESISRPMQSHEYSKNMPENISLAEHSVRPENIGLPPSRPGYRNTSDGRAKMAPEVLQQGVYQSGNMI